MGVLTSGVVVSASCVMDDFRFAGPFRIDTGLSPEVFPDGAPTFLLPLPAMASPLRRPGQEPGRLKARPECEGKVED